MTARKGQKSPWGLARRQHGVITRAQLLELGFSAAAIKHRIAAGRLHPLWRGVYAAGRPDVSREGRWLAAVLRCGRGAALSHWDAACLWKMRRERPGPVHVSVPVTAHPRPPGIVVHRRAGFEITIRAGTPVTTPACTLVDLAVCLEPGQLETAVNEADKHDLIDPEALRTALDRMAGRRGVAALRRILDRRTFALTDSELERRFLPIARRAGLPQPETGVHLNGFKVDFYWPDLGLVVEVDGLRYHRTPGQQAKDRLRDQAHTAAGLTQLRFTRAQVVFDAAHVESTLAAVASRVRYPLASAY
jgi:very-short-patch-repair endonuclease/predicted transcriptional regulator of viral defense system